MPTPSGFYRLWSLSTAALSFILFGLSVAGLVVSRKSLKLRYRHFGGIRIYMPGQPMNDVYPPSQRDRSNPNWAYANRTGWNYQLVPRNLQYGNEFVVLGCSVAILVLVLLPLLTSVFAKPRPFYHSNPSGFPRLNIVLAACTVLVSFIGLIYTQVAIKPTHYDFSRFNYPAPEDWSVEEKTVGNTGVFSMESWTCNLKDLMIRGTSFGFSYEDMDRTCNLVIAAKWLMIPLFLVSISLVLLCFFTRRKALQVLEAMGGHKKPMELEGMKVRGIPDTEELSRPSSRREWTRAECM